MWEMDYEESWVLKNWCFELWCWRRLLRVPWTARSNQSVLEEISPKYSLKRMKLQHFGHLMRRTNSLEKTLMLGKIEAGGEGVDRGWDSWMASPTRWTWVWLGSRSWWWTGRPGALQPMESLGVRHDWVTELNGHKVLRAPGKKTPRKDVCELILSYYTIWILT